MTKTLVGKEEYLFLINDSSNELEIHCNNLNLVNENNLSRYSFDKYLLLVYPNKSLFYKKYLPENYLVKYRPALGVYKNKLQNKMVDLYKYMSTNDDLYYKTDTHINLKGNYITYQIFINKINEMFYFNITPKNIIIKKQICELSTLPYGLGDLIWSQNLGEQQLNNKLDKYYFSDEIDDFYNIYKIKNNNPIRFLIPNTLDDYTFELEQQNEFAHWNIISKYIIYKKNKNIEPKSRVLIFYDSFLLHSLPLYFQLFYEVYFSKNIYNNETIQLINPDYVFEFRVERFLF